MRKNKIHIIVPFRNCKDFIKECYDSILLQDYDNWVAYFCDDNSDDNTSDSIIANIKFNNRKNTKTLGSLSNIHNCIMNLQKVGANDIVCILDGDDKFLNNNSLSIINSLYQDNTLLTYGQYVYPDMKIGHCHEYTSSEYNNLRKSGFIASHCRTFKYKLYQRFLRIDPSLSYYKDINGNFYKYASDVAMTTPLMEIAGLENIKFNNIPIYYYRLHPSNEDPTRQIEDANEIFNKLPIINEVNINIEDKIKIFHSKYSLNVFNYTFKIGIKIFKK